jgi:hypothetical protein
MSVLPDVDGLVLGCRAVTTNYNPIAKSKYSPTCRPRDFLFRVNA